MPVSRIAIRNIIFGAGVLIGFGALWAFGAIWLGASTLGLPPLMVGSFSVTAVLLVVILVAPCVSLGQLAKGLPASGNREEVEYWQAAGAVFGLIFILELFLIAIAAAVLGRTGHAALIPPVIALVVGLHFIPFAPLFRMPEYYVVGAAMNVLAIFCIIAVSAGLRLGTAPLFIWSFFLSLSNAAILWAAAFRVLVQGFTLRIQADATPTA